MDHKNFKQIGVPFRKILHYADEKETLYDGASVVALTYIGAQPIFSKYSDMNDAKALLESIARNYGSRLADRGIRVNTAGCGVTWLHLCWIHAQNIIFTGLILNINS